MTSPLRILLIDDNRSDRTLVLRELEREFDPLDVQEITSSGELNQAIAAGNFDAVVTDFQLRWSTGLDVLEMVKQRHPNCPVVMFTNTGTEEVAVEAMKLGLDDYIVKGPNRYIRVPIALRMAIERREMQQRAALLEIRLRGLLNRVKIGIFRFDAEGALIEANRAFLELLGAQSLAQASTMNWFDMRDCYRQLMHLPPPQQQEQEVNLQRSDGTEFWALLTTTLNTVEEVTVVDGLLEDISDRKQAEVDLQQLNTTLEIRVQERTIELQAANQDLEEFAYSVSHDLQAPLRAIQGFAQILLEDLSETLDASSSATLQRIVANAQHLNTLITDLLTYSRLRRAEIHSEPVSLSSVLDNVMAQLNSDIQQQQAQVHIDEPLPIVQANRLILTQVLSNLLFNAVKFVAEGVQPQVRIWAEERVEAGEPSTVRLYIEDNGIGIALDRHEQIFSPFTRLHGEADYPGTGIGLAIVRKGVERMGGQVGVESEPGQGSRFWVELPGVREP
ncbi:response regulator [Nodosilinea sp. LEGE 06152]|uniref:sensor histidine kinase n=1 Tax=Nodosilinea sp. LEGE 06152 TaxID=2777966 RepID=UPI00188106E6|nr:ATP-binding protein [Nodosilinea sp. LEGE 06152]MBE9157279.1 response regulator [Nodosilinea sp. LEGE 06152]